MTGFGDDDPDDAFDSRDNLEDMAFNFVNRLNYVTEHAALDDDMVARIGRLTADLMLLRARVITRDL
jgi:hypothetical protein